MMTGETFTEQMEFDGNASAVVIITNKIYCAAKKFECNLEGIALGNYSRKIPISIYIWDERESSAARAYYDSTFEIGSFWRISGKIEIGEEGSPVFIDPVYMPYRGAACKVLEAYFKE